MFALEQHTIFLTLAGSQAHGTAREGSDLDLRGVCVAPLSVRLSLFLAFEQHEGALPEPLAETVLSRLEGHPTASRALDIETECVIFDVAKFVRLCAAANPNALEILFADERVQQTFHGYAMAPLTKIKTHRSWLPSPPTQKPSREDFGLPGAGGTLGRDDQNRIEQSIADKLRSYGIDNIDMPKPTRIAVQERLDAFYRDALSASDEDLGERMRSGGHEALGLLPDLEEPPESSARRARTPARLRHQARHASDPPHAHGPRGPRDRRSPRAARRRR